jgi:hypothetical protein
MRVNQTAPDSSLAEMERAQAALREGIERARRLLREAKLEIGGPCLSQCARTARARSS